MMGKGTGEQQLHQEGNERGTLSLYRYMNESVPPYFKSTTAVEQTIEEDFTKLSVDDRSKIDQEIDGTYCMAIKETPELLYTSLEKLKIELASIPYKKKVAYNESLKLPGSHISDERFRLRFLRSQRFQVRHAAIRLVKYCDFVLDLFGSFALERHIELNDFSKNEMKLMLKGYVQLMPFRDQSGRRVIFHNKDSNVMIEPLSRLKIYIYMAMVASMDLETQRKGVVLVVWTGGSGKDWKQPLKSDARAHHIITQRHEVLPVRIAGYHYCMPDNPIFYLIRSFAVLYGGFGGGIKSRMRFHIGVDTELRYMLQGFGIPIDFIPVTGTGNIKLNFLKQWIHVRRIVEAEARANGKIATTGQVVSATIVECPGSNDVIFKPGKRLVYHPGNILFQGLILSKLNEYTTTSSKRGLYRWLIIEIKEKRKGRFLKWNDDDYWTEIKDEAHITIKISTFCKAVASNQKRFNNAKKNSTLVECSTDAFTSDNTDDSILCNNNIDRDTSNKRQRSDEFPFCT